MIRIVALALVAGALYLALLSEVERLDEITLQQRTELNERSA